MSSALTSSMEFTTTSIGGRTYTGAALPLSLPLNELLNYGLAANDRTSNLVLSLSAPPVCAPLSSDHLPINKKLDFVAARGLNSRQNSTYPCASLWLLLDRCGCLFSLFFLPVPLFFLGSFMDTALCFTHGGTWGDSWQTS